MRLKTPTRMGALPEEIAAPGETCPLRAVCSVVQDMLALKYGMQLDEDDFVSKAKVRCDPDARQLPDRLAAALNEEPALRVKDAGHERLLQLQLGIHAVTSFAELCGHVRQWPGTACAVASVAAGTGHKARLVAAYREAYGGGQALVGRTWERSTGRAGPLHTFNAGTFHGAVLLDPVVARVLKYESEPNRMLDLHIPAVCAEYERAQCRRGTEGTELAVEACAVLAGLAPRPGASPETEGAAARACRFVAELMSVHLSEAEVQAAACRALGALVPACGPASLAGAAQSAVELAIAAMRRHARVAAVQEAACAVVAGVAGSRIELQSFTIANGGMEQVVRAMRQFPDVVELQTWACGALASLAANNPTNQSAITGSGGIDAVVAAMKLHAASSQLQTMACGALGNIAANHQNNQATIAAGGGLQLIVDAMRQHSDSVAAQLSAIGALWCLVKGNTENQAAVARSGAAELIVGAVERHAGDAALRAMATGALQVLVPGLDGAMAVARSQAGEEARGPRTARDRLPVVQEAR